MTKNAEVSVHFGNGRSNLPGYQTTHPTQLTDTVTMKEKFVEKVLWIRSFGANITICMA